MDAQPERAARSHLPYRTLLTAILMGFALLGDSMLYAVLPTRAPEAGVTAVQVGILLSVNRWVRLVTNSLAGRTGERVGWSWAFVAALWLGAATTAVYGLASSFWLLLAARLAWGLSWSFQRLAAFGAIIADSSPADRGRLAGLANGVFRLGSLVGALAGGLLTDAVGFRPTLWLFAGISGAGALAATWGALRRPDLSPPHRLNGPAAPPARRVGCPTAPAGDGPPPVRRAALYLGAFATQLVVSGLVTATMGLLVVRRLGTMVNLPGFVLGAASFSGVMLTARWLVDLALGAPLGALSDRMGRDRTLAAAVGLCIVGLLALSVARSAGAVAGGAALVWLTGTTLAATLDARAAEWAGSRPERTLARYATAGDTGAALGPLLGTLLAERWDLAVAYRAAAGILTAFWLVHAAAAFRRSRDGSTPPPVRPDPLAPPSGP